MSPSRIRKISGKKLVGAIILLIVGLIFIYCSFNNNEIGNISVDISNTYIESSTNQEEEFNLPNCEGTSPLERSLNVSGEVERDITFGLAKEEGTGAMVDIPEALRVQLEDKIRLEYEQIYKNLLRRIDECRMRAEPGTHVVYIIQWKARSYVSTLSYTWEGITYTAPYTLTFIIPEVVDSRNIPCTNTVTFSPSPEAFTPTETLTPTNTPTETPTLTLTSRPRPISSPSFSPTPTPAPPRLGEVARVPPCTFIFHWEWDGQLAEDEYFALRVGIGSPGHSDTWTKDFSQALVLSDGGEYYWEVAICQGDPSEHHCNQRAVSEQGKFWFNGCPPTPCTHC